MAERTSVIVTELHLEGVTIGESETDPPLVVHSDRVLPLAIATEGMQPIAAPSREVGEFRRDMDRVKLPVCPPCEVRRDPPRNAFAEQGFGPFVGEALDHGRV